MYFKVETRVGVMWKDFATVEFLHNQISFHNSKVVSISEFIIVFKIIIIF